MIFGKEHAPLRILETIQESLLAVRATGITAGLESLVAEVTVLRVDNKKLAITKVVLEPRHRLSSLSRNLAS